MIFIVEPYNSTVCIDGDQNQQADTMCVRGQNFPMTEIYYIQADSKYVYFTCYFIILY